jgi:dTDP-4-dehydrorhamnose reductase
VSKVIIFGASGFLGKELVKKSDSFDWNVLYPDSKTVNLCDYDLVNNYLARNVYIK